MSRFCASTVMQLPQGRADRVAMAAAALCTAIGHRGAPEIFHCTPSAVGSHQGPQLLPLVARRKQLISSAVLILVGATICARYGMQDTQKLFHCFARIAAEAGHAIMASTRVRMESMHFRHVPCERRRPGCPKCHGVEEAPWPAPPGAPRGSAPQIVCRSAQKGCISWPSSTEGVVAVVPPLT